MFYSILSHVKMFVKNIVNFTKLITDNNLDFDEINWKIN